MDTLVNLSKCIVSKATSHSHVRQLHALIAGGGIGGLTSALALVHFNENINVTVTESVLLVKPIGLGINLLPHGVSILTKLGLLTHLRECAIETKALEYRTKHDELLYTDFRGKYAGLKYEQFSIHRGHLQTILLNAIRTHPRIRFLEGYHLRSYIESEDKVTAIYANNEQIEADILIGSDGINSQVTQQMHPILATQYNDSGILMYRGLTTLKTKWLDGQTMVIAGNQDHVKLVVYPICQKSNLQGYSLLNWVVEVRTHQPKQYQYKPNWNNTAVFSDVIPYFNDWNPTIHNLSLQSLIKNCSKIFTFSMLDRDPLPFWVTSRVVLLGDAAHPMYPIGSNGASQAIIDSYILAQMIAKYTNNNNHYHHKNEMGESRSTCTTNTNTTSSTTATTTTTTTTASSSSMAIIEALKEYERIRLPATSQVIYANRALGPEKILSMSPSLSSTSSSSSSAFSYSSSSSAVEVVVVASASSKQYNISSNMTIPHSDNSKYIQSIYEKETYAEVIRAYQQTAGFDHHTLSTI